MKKKGFTLIELMIVLAIIAILAVVLVPKAGTLKNSARDAGVSTNVNSVRAFLETKVSDTTYFVNTAGATKTASTLGTAMTGENAITNPLSKGTVIPAGVTVDVANNAPANSSVVVYDSTSTTVASVSIGSPHASNKGMVFVYVCSDGFVVFGVDNQQAVVNKSTVK